MTESGIFIPSLTCDTGGTECVKLECCHAYYLLLKEMNTTLPGKFLAIESLINNVECTHPSYLALREKARLLLASQK